MKRTHLLQRGKARVAQILCMVVLAACALTCQADPLVDGKKAGQEQHTHSPWNSLEIFLIYIKYFSISKNFKSQLISK